MDSTQAGEPAGSEEGDRRAESDDRGGSNGGRDGNNGDRDGDNGDRDGEDESSVYTPPMLAHGLTAPLDDPREWFFLVENRLVIAGLFVAGVFASLLASEYVSGAGIAETVPILYVFSSLIGGNFTLVTIVISVSQLVVSQQLGSPGDLRERIKETNQYRDEVEEAVGREVAPVTPTDFLQLLLERTDNEVEALREEVEDVSDRELRNELEELLDDVDEHTEHVIALLSRSEVGLFEALSVTLQTNYAGEIYRVRQVGNVGEGSLSETVENSLERIALRLQQIDVARQYLKTLYMQDELARLSRFLLYAGAPAILVSVLALHQFGMYSDAAVSQSTLAALVPAAVAVGAAPLAVLFAFVLRISMVTQRTAAITPFTTPQQEQDPLPGPSIPSGDDD